ncbi:MAG: hypothetical protein CL569_08440 [Alphaproteobacteria bacterium]|nr:hypothetical protein [Alphaproteobacteria bacterium]|tara:strand:- start:6342 stop:6941 length:600 start_codon:yes stop_codon:yes gene_type:complete
MLHRNPPASTSLTEAAVETIRDRILDLTQKPGIRIDEKVLMERFSLSRTPPREALHHLVAEGLVQIQPKKGAYVRPLDVSHIRKLFDAYFVSERMNGFFCQTSDPGLVTDIETLQNAYEKAQKARKFLDMTRINAQLDRHQTRIRKDHLDIIKTIKRNDNDRLVDVMTQHAQLFHERIMRPIGETLGADAPLPPKGVDG